MPHSLDIGKGRIRALVKATPEALPRLPLVHSTDSYVFEDILADKATTPQNCDVFIGEALTYFFMANQHFDRISVRSQLHSNIIFRFACSSSRPGRR